MTAPGWYPDPAGGGTRFWDGQAWTDRLVADKPPGKGIPGWALIGWFVVMALAAFAGFWFVLLMTAFGCDSGWDGCVGVGETAWVVYTGMCVVGLVGLLVWSLISRSATVRIVAFLGMPAVVALALGVSTLVYFLLANWLA
ncbi:MAG: DUF2510 domain-containing protein [Candidatus Nanopelagicales bacterium]